jgi:WXG100 family type VII secretion target
MGKDMDVTYDDMHGAADHLTTQHGDLKETLDTLKDYVRNLTEDGYVTSASSEAFYEAYNEFTDGVTQTLEGMLGMASFLDDTANSLEEQDQERAASVRGN